MNELLRFARFGGVEAQGAAIGISMAVADRPGGVIAFVIAFKVAVAIDKIAGGVGELFQGTKNLGTGGRPIGRSDEALETELTEESNCLLVEPGLLCE